MTPRTSTPAALAVALVALAAPSALAASSGSASATAVVAISTAGTSACPASPDNKVVDGMAKNFPTLFETAKIVSGDTVATQLWTAIQNNSTYAAALAIKPTVVKNYNPSFTGYDANSDPACWWTDTNCVKPKQKYLPNDHITCNEPFTWGLSVDDGPLPAHCHLYSLYKQNNIIPSLFYIGSNVIQNPGSAAEGLATGGPICVHTWSHQYTTSLTNEEVFAELYYTKLAIKRVIGYTPRCFRPPFGDVDDRVRAIAYALEMDVWIWDNDTNDWELGEGATAAQIQTNFNKIIAQANSTGGTIVLDHELSVPIANQWITNYPAIKKAYKNIVAAHICENVTAPWAEPNAPQYPDFNSWLGGATATGSLVATVNATAQIYMAGVGANQKLPFTGSSTSSSTNSSSSTSGSSSSGSSTSGSGKNGNSTLPSGVNNVAGSAASSSASPSTTTGGAPLAASLSGGLVALAALIGAALRLA